MKSMTKRLRPYVAVLAAMAMVAVACGGDDAPAEAPEPAEEPAEEAPADEPDAEPGEATDTVDLSGVCPDNIVVQLDWEPESEHGMIYSLVGAPYEIDADAKSVRGPLMHHGESTGVDIEIRIGGAAVGYQDAQSLLYQDPDIMFGFGRVGEMMTTHDRLPIVGVLATFEKSPYSVYWDPETYPDVQDMADLGDEGVEILVGPGTNVWADWFVSEGIWEENQVYRSDFSKPATFIAAGGQSAEAGFATAEPFLYEVEVADEWGRPVEIALIHDAGFEEYFQVLTVRADDVEGERACLEQLVPVMQAGGPAYLENPDPVHDLVLELVDAYDTGWVYTKATAEFADEKMIELGIFANGSDGTYGSFDIPRLENLRDIVATVSAPEVADLDVNELVTNEFLDPSISLP